MPGDLSDTSSVLYYPNLILVVKCQYIARDYLITKAKMQTNSEAMSAIVILLKKVFLCRVMRGQVGRE